MKKSLLIVLCCMVQLATAKVYTWEDEKGNTVFSDIPPKNGKASEFKFKDQLVLVNLPKTSKNLMGKWTQFDTDGEYTTIEFLDQGQVIVYKYSNFDVYYQAKGDWSIKEDSIDVIIRSVINQQSNYQSDDPYLEKWHIDVLYAKEMSLIIEGELSTYNR